MRRFIWTTILILFLITTGHAAEIYIDGRAYEVVDVVEFEFGERIEQTQDDILKIHGTGGLANTDLKIDLDGLGPTLYSTTDTVININDNLSITGTLVASGGTSLAGDLTLDDGVGDSPNLVLQCQGDKTLVLQKLDAGAGIITNTEGEIDLLPSNDIDDYFTFATTANVPTIGTTGTCDLKITSSSGTISFDDENLSGTGSLTFGNIQSGANGVDGQITIYSEQGATDYSIIFKPNATMTQTTTYTLPPDDGTNTFVLQTDGSGGLTWVAAGAGDITTVGSATTGDAFVDGTNHTLTFEGSTNDTVESILGATDPTSADQIFNLPDMAAGGTYVLMTTATNLAGDVTGPSTATVVGDDSHAHTTTTISGLDISADTNLAGDTEIVLTGDALSIASAITRDTEWSGINFITQTAQGALSAEQALGVLATGILKNTITTGVLSIAVAGTDYQAPLTNPMVYGDARFKVGSFTRAMTAASGDVSYTGVGFTPKAILFLAQSTNSIGEGIDNGTTHAGFHAYLASTVFNPNGVWSIMLRESGTQYQRAFVASFDADGFTLTWELGGTPTTVTETVNYIAFR